MRGATIGGLDPPRETEHIRPDQRNIPKRRAAAQRRRRQRRRGLALGAAIVVLLALAVAALLRHRGTSHVTAKTTPRASMRPLSPPGPIPGYLLIADRGNNRMLLVDSAKRIYWTYPKPGSTPAMPFRFDDDTFFGPRRDRIVSNQEEQQTIQIISFPGRRLLWRYGHVNHKSSAPGHLNSPDDAYLLPNGLVEVADAYNCRALFISPAHRIVRQYGTTGVCRHDPPRLLGAINAATPLPDGGTLISEITGSWVDDIGPTGKLRWAVQAPVSYPSDPQLLAPNRILLADYARPGHVIVMTHTGRVLWRYGPASGPGALDHPSLATLIAPDLIAINDDFRHRVVIVSMRTRKIVWQYGHTDSPGSGPGYLHTPDGLDLLPIAAARRLPAIQGLLRPARASGATGALAVSTAYDLPAPVEREVAVAADGGIVIAGGLDAAGRSTSGVFRLAPGSGRLTALGSVPQPFHDAAGAVLGGRLLVFGGGTGQSSASVQEFDLSSHRSAVVGQLPRALSDLAAAQAGGAVYLVGGFDGSRPRSEIYRTSDGRQFALAGRLPVGLRYAAVAALAGKLVVAGGIGPGGPTSSVYLFDPVSGRTLLLGRLPAATAHAAAVRLGGSVYVVGGSSGSMARVDLTGVRAVGSSAPVAVSDTAAVMLAGRAFLIGGTRAGKAVAAVQELTVR